MDRKSIINATHLLDLNSNYAIHQWITQQQDMPRDKAKMLYRVVTQDDTIYLYVQSKDKFNTTNYTQYGLCLVKELDLDQLFNNVGDILYFDVKTFPCKTNSAGRRYFLRDQHDRYQWLSKQFEHYDIELVNCSEYQQNYHILDKNKKNPTRMESTTYRGAIKINNRDKAFEMITNGIGRVKTFGLGLVLFK